MSTGIETNLFEQASRKKLRFDTPKGSLTVEDLWDLPLTTKVQNGASLELLGQQLQTKVREAENSTFVISEEKSQSEAKNIASKILNLKFAVLKYIISVRLAENEEKAQAAAKLETKTKLRIALERKKDAALESMSVEEIEKLLATV
jgi:hypothetical protein